MIASHFPLILHISGAFAILMALGAVLFHTALGGTREHPWRRKLALIHGIGMFLSLMGGLLALRSLDESIAWGWWLYLKIFIWLFMGAALGLAYRRPKQAGLFFMIVLFMAVVAALLGLSKGL